MTEDAVWADAVPNFLIGLREGLEGGLVVSILLAAVTRSTSTATKGSATERSATEGLATEGLATEGLATEGSVAKGSVAKGLATEGSVAKGSAPGRSAAKGPASKGSATERPASRGSASRGPATEGPATERPAIKRPIWLGVLAALILSISFGALLTFSRSALASGAQEAFGGILSVIAVVLVTAMIFWMRRTARTLSGELNAKVDIALKLGAGALAATAFLAVAREGLETALFLWTAVQASGQTVGPLIGAGVGVAVAVALCWLLYRRAVRINLGVFFARTAIALVVIAGGVLAYGLGELQESGLLPGRAWIAFDLTNTIGTDSWWVSLIRGITNLTPTMTWLQVVAYIGYITTVLVVFRQVQTTRAASERSWFRLPTVGNRWTAIGAAVLVPLLAVGAFALFTTGNAAGADNTVTVTASACAPDFNTLATGSQTFTVVNKSGRGGEVLFTQATGGGVVGEIESIGPGTRTTLTVTVAAGSYAWRCAMSGVPAQLSAVVRTSGDNTRTFSRMFAVPPLQPSELDVPIHEYQTYVAGQLGTLADEAATLNTAIGAGNLDAARAAWLPAQLTWERVGAAYDSFGDAATAIDGLPDGLPLGVDDPGFTGLRRIEYGLWHGQPAATLAPVASKLIQDITTLQQNLSSLTVNPKDMPIRLHEILEDAQRDHLSGMTDQGAGSGYAETLADVDGTRVVLGELRDLINQRKPGLVDAIEPQLDTLQRALAATEHNGVFDNEMTAPLAERQRVNAAIGQALETLSPVPDLLEIGAS